MIALDHAAVPAARELLNMVLAALSGDYVRGEGLVTRPDGIAVPIDRDDPMATLCRLLAEDLCLMQRRDGDGESVLTAAALCFPAGWTLAQKFLRQMIAIHAPIARYDADLAARVQRLLDGVRPGRGLMRGAAHWCGSPLHHPLNEDEKFASPGDTPNIRVERQCLFRLPDTRAVMFSIHTSIVAPSALTPHQAETLAEFPIRRSA
ncbi:MAG: DUF3445 domain-containing protein [Paracoccus sp. (in: a-proteobacteria)]|nr:DUF3445 domain-containing protein [Paracoccus sp. (in: a-proteobacteria)]